PPAAADYLRFWPDNSECNRCCTRFRGQAPGSGAASAIECAGADTRSGLAADYCGKAVRPYYAAADPAANSFNMRTDSASKTSAASAEKGVASISYPPSAYAWRTGI